VTVWGLVAAGVNKRWRWSWILAVVLAFFIGFSRLYLGVHFVYDVIAGWVIGSLMLMAFL
jgi:membrane-associated phospholipid phosphatase